MRWVLCTCVLLLWGCAEKNEAYYARRGSAVVLELTDELEGISTVHDLFSRQESLSILFDELARLAIEARGYQIRRTVPLEPTSEALDVNKKFYQEFKRVLAIPGARSFLEKCQTKGLERIAKASYESQQTNGQIR